MKIKEVITMNKNILIRFEPFTTNKIKGVVLDFDDKYQIVIDSSLSEREQFDTILHELSHIYLKHFTPGTRADIAELETHELLKEGVKTCI